jgi:hypothetical protein
MKEIIELDSIYFSVNLKAPKRNKRLVIPSKDPAGLIGE